MPRRTRQRFRVSFYLKDGLAFHSDIAIEPPFVENLRKYRDAVQQANASSWCRPRMKAVYMGEENGKAVWKWGPVLDPKTGKPVIDYQLVDVKAKCLGADI